MAFDVLAFVQRELARPSEPSKRAGNNKSGKAARKRAYGQKWVQTGSTGRQRPPGEYNPQGPYNYVGRSSRT
jgi:hypothetical protein